MADEVKCICGHPKSEHHQSMITQVAQMCLHDWSKENPQSRCRCPLFRECLSWPNEVGKWWCDKLADVPHVFGGDRLWIERWRSRESFEEEYGPARFTKLIEQNPFPPSR